MEMVYELFPVRYKKFLLTFSHPTLYLKCLPSSLYSKFSLQLRLSLILGNLLGTCQLSVIMPLQYFRHNYKIQNSANDVLTFLFCICSMPLTRLKAILDGVSIQYLIVVPVSDRSQQMRMIKIIYRQIPKYISALYSSL